MRLRFYAGLLLGLLATALGFVDLFLLPEPHPLRASLGILVGAAIIVIAVLFATKKESAPSQTGGGSGDEP